MNQTERIRAYLESHYCITPKQAMDDLGIYRLGARIYDLKKEGVPIKSGWLKTKNRYGEKTRVRMYWIAGKPEEAFR